MIASGYDDLKCTDPDEESCPCRFCDSDPCVCPEPDFEQMVADRADWLAS